MTAWYEIVNQLAEQGEAYVIVTVLGARGSTPRDSGTKMVVAATETYCSIGGGHLEYKAISIAKELLADSKAEQRIEHFPLGAKLGQCCGGSATLLFESFSAVELNIMLFGAGHVGKSLAGILAQLPCRLHWVDGREAEFPAQLPSNVVKVVNDCPADEVAAMPANSYFIIMTHNHPLDFAITETVIKKGDARYIGLIGSETKWKRFKMRFDHRQYEKSVYEQVRCPVGLSDVPGKLPVEVAVSVAAEVIGEVHRHKASRSNQQGIGWRELKALNSEAAASNAIPKTEIPTPVTSDNQTQPEQIR